MTLIRSRVELGDEWTRSNAVGQQPVRGRQRLVLTGTGVTDYQGECRISLGKTGAVRAPSFGDWLTFGAYAVPSIPNIASDRFRVAFIRETPEVLATAKWLAIAPTLSAKVHAVVHHGGHRESGLR